MKNFSLQTVLDLMQTRTDEAARELGRRLAIEHDARKQMLMLEDYREEYSRRFQAASQAGLSPSQWANYRDFLGRLDEAIGQQALVVAQSETRTSEGQHAWVAQRGRLQAFDTLAERHQQGERRRENRQEQKISDEFAARRRSDD